MTDEVVDTRPECGRKIAPCCIIPQRVLTVIMSAMGLLCAYALNTAYAITITQIVIPRKYGSNATQLCPGSSELSHRETSTEGKYDWSQSTQSLCLLSYYIGYIFTQVPGGILAQKFGAIYVLSGSIFMGSVCVLLIPVCVERFDYPALVVLRILLGLFEGPMFPSVSVILSQWVPKKERSTLGAIIMSGYLWGTILATLISGQILRVHKWHLVFYCFGTLGVAWSIAFILLCHRGPSKNPFISLKEKKYLAEQMGNSGGEKPKLKTPWKKILRSLPVWAMVVAQMGHDWGFFLVVGFLPKYMNDVLRLPLAKNSLFSALPFLCMWIVSLFAGATADLLINKKVLSTLNTRRLMSCIGNCGPAIFMQIASYSGCDHVLVMLLFCFSQATMACYFAGFRLAGNDMSPNFAGVIMGIANGSGALGGVIAPFMVGLMAPHSTFEEWQNVFWLAFVVQVGSIVFYCICGSTDVQPWNEPENSEKN